MVLFFFGYLLSLQESKVNESVLVYSGFLKWNMSLNTITWKKVYYELNFRKIKNIYKTIIDNFFFSCVLFLSLGCCCPSSLVQNVHDSCLLRKSIVAYPHMASHHSHTATSPFSSEAMCPDYHSSNTTLDHQRHHMPHYTISSPTHSRVACCACCELQRESNHQHHHHHHQSSLHYVSQPKTSSSLVPCEQSPLDLSLTSSTSNVSIESDISLSQGHCSSPMCCRDLLLLRTSPHSFQHNNFTPSKSCCRCNKQTICDTQAVDTVQSLSCSSKSIMKIDQPHAVVDHVTLLATSPNQGSVHPVASTSGVANKSVPRIITDDTLLIAKQEKSFSPKQSSKFYSASKKRMFAHGWSWKGKPREKLITLTVSLIIFNFKYIPKGLWIEWSNKWCV